LSIVAIAQAWFAVHHVGVSCTLIGIGR